MASNREYKRLAPPWITPATGSPNRKLMQVISRRKTTAYDSEVQAWIDSRAALSDPVGTPYADAVNAFIVAMKGISGWSSAGQQILIPAGAATIAGALTPIRGITPTGTSMANSDVVLRTGVAGSTTNKSINTGYAGSSVGASQNSVHMYMHLTATPASGAALFGHGGAAGTGATSFLYNNGTRCRNATIQSQTGTGTGGYGVNRNGSANYERMIAGGLTTGTIGSQASNGGALLLLARSQAGTAVAEAWGASRFIIWVLGGGITTLADYTTPAATLVAALNAI